MIDAMGIQLAERGLLPTPVMRVGIRRLLAERIRELSGSAEERRFAGSLRASPIAVATDEANEQHYEVPSRFFELVLGTHLKYSGCYWPDGVSCLDDAERAALDQVCERADIRDGQDILELGCGWGSLSLHLARRFPNARITAVSNSHGQRAFITTRAPANLRVLTRDVSTLHLNERFDRIVSVEMFEHMRNYAALLQRIASWLRPDGRLFVHVFCHRTSSYRFETEGSGNWMGANFFTGGIMPGADLLPMFDEHLELERRWLVNGMHYQRTAASWRQNLEARRRNIVRLFEDVYGADATRWYHRWRIFFLACEELFGYRNGNEWMVAHYRFAPAATRASMGAMAAAGAR